MHKEDARVVEVQGDYAWVETQRRAVCDGCAVNQGCGSGVLSRVLGRRRLRVRVLNPIGARVGDQVEVGIEEDMLVKGSMAAYALPVAALLLGAALGEWLSGPLGLAHSEGLTIALGFCGLAAGFAWLRHYSGKLSGDRRSHPCILRCIGAAFGPPAGREL